jgi:hypothetical protein
MNQRSLRRAVARASAAAGLGPSLALVLIAHGGGSLADASDSTTICPSIDPITGLCDPINSLLSPDPSPTATQTTASPTSTVTSPAPASSPTAALSPTSGTPIRA